MVKVVLSGLANVSGMKSPILLSWTLMIECLMLAAEQIQKATDTLSASLQHPVSLRGSWISPPEEATEGRNIQN